MSETAFKVHEASSRHASPWTLQEQLKQLLWTFVWPLLCGWTPKHLNAWRLLWLKVFGCKIDGKPFVHQRARIQIPWNLLLHDRSCVGDRANLYSLGEIELGQGCVIAQEAYICAGTHDFSDPKQPLLTAKISIGKDAFVGARAFVMPGTRIGDAAIIGACSVVTRDVPPRTINAGNPSRVLRSRSEC